MRGKMGESEVPAGRRGRLKGHTMWDETREGHEAW